MMLILWCGFLFLSHILCYVHPCDPKREYPYNNNQCCKKCEPGYRMAKRCTRNSPTDCKECNSDFYMDEYSIEMQCWRCSQCTKEHMVYKEKCSKSTDAVCDCEMGYECNSKPCTSCVKIPPPTPPPPTTTLPPPTTTTTRPTTRPTTTSEVLPSTKNDAPKTPHSPDTVSITLSLCCVCILLTCFILISRHTRPCGWIMLATADLFGWSKKNSAESSQCTEDEEVPMPVQEVCGYKEWQEEI